MTDENPTADGGASISERIEAYLNASDPQPAQSEPTKDAQSIPEEPPETPDAEPAGDEHTESDEPQLTLSDVAKILGVEESTLDVDEDGTVKVKTKIDGKEGAAKFNDLVKSYQLQGHVDAKAREAAEQAKVLQERVQQFEQFAQSEAQKFSQLASIANQELMRDLGNINWQELARNDPAEYVAKQAEYQDRQARISQLMQASQYQQQQAMQAQQMRMQKTFESEAARLPTLIPEWSDANKAKAEKAELREWMKSSGFSDADISNLYRADLVATLRKAMLFDKGQTKAQNIVEKKLRVAPKLVKPGQSTDANQRAQDSVRSLKQTIRESGGKKGIAEYLMATGKV